MFGLGVQVQRKVAYVVGAVGDEGDLPVHLHALGAERLEEAAFGFGVVGLDEPEVLGGALGRYGLAGDHLEPAVTAGALLARVDVAAVEADDEGQARVGELFPLGRAAFHEGPLLGAEFVFETLGDGLGVLSHRGGVEGTAEGEDLGQDLGGEPVGDQPGELGFQVDELGCGPLGEDGCQGAERAGGLRPLATVVPAGAPQA